jgi:hypothetical protein
MSLKERGDRRRPRIANLVQFPVTSNCSIASKRLHALTHSLTFVPAYTKSASVGPLAVARLTQGISPKNCRTRSRVGLRSLAICVISTSLSSDRGAGTGLSTAAR